MITKDLEKEFKKRGRDCEIRSENVVDRKIYYGFVKPESKDKELKDIKFSCRVSSRKDIYGNKWYYFESSANNIKKISKQVNEFVKEIKGLRD